MNLKIGRIEHVSLERSVDWSTCASALEASGGPSAHEVEFRCPLRPQIETEKAPSRDESLVCRAEGIV